MFCNAQTWFSEIACHIWLKLSCLVQGRVLGPLLAGYKQLVKHHQRNVFKWNGTQFQTKNVTSFIDIALWKFEVVNQHQT